MIEWFARNSVAANLMMAFIIVSGILATTSVREEHFPEMALDRINVEVPYLGAAPEEVEEAVNVRIEEAIQGIEGIKQIQSTASEGMGTVTVEIELGADARRVVDDVKSKIDTITTFPLEAETPIIRELTVRQQVVDIAVSGNVDPFTLKQVAQRVRDELTAIPEITRVDLVSAPPYEISIEVSEDDLRRHRLTFEQVANAVRRSSLDLPGGSVRTERGEILLRTIGQAYRGAEYENLVLWTLADGTRLRLGDVATVVDGFEETEVEAAVGHAQKTPLRGLRFERLDVAQAYLDRWERRWADTRIHGTTKRQVAAMFAEERPALGPLPLEPFRYYQYGRRTVHLDGCVEVASAYYRGRTGHGRNSTFRRARRGSSR